MKRYYIRTIGSACYNAFGLTYPVAKRCDFKAEVKTHGGKNPQWRKEFGQSNLPQIVTFSADDNQAKKIQKQLRKVCGNHLYVREVN